METCVVVIMHCVAKLRIVIAGVERALKLRVRMFGENDIPDSHDSLFRSVVVCYQSMEIRHISTFSLVKGNIAIGRGKIIQIDMTNDGIGVAMSAKINIIARYPHVVYRAVAGKQCFAAT